MWRPALVILVLALGCAAAEAAAPASNTPASNTPASNTPAATPPASDHGFDDGSARSVSLLTNNGQSFLVDVTIGGRGPFPFALDSGSGDAIDALLAAELNLVPAGTVAVRGAGERMVELPVATLPSIEIGMASLRGLPVRVLPPAPDSLKLAPAYRGLLGRELFERFVVRIDQDRRELVLSDPAHYRYDGDGQKMLLDLGRGVPVVAGSIDGTAGLFSLDTGQANTLTLFRPFIARAGLEHRWNPVLTAPVAWGVGGDIMAEVARGNLLALGAVPVDRPVLYLSLQQAGAFSDSDLAGNVGQGVFSRFNVVFDYPGRAAWFERALTYGAGDSLHVMTLKRSFTGFTVLSVLPGGSAAAAGLRAGDVIEEFDRRDAKTLESYDLNRLFRGSPGRRIELQVRTDGRLRNLVLVLMPTV